MGQLLADYLPFVIFAVMIVAAGLWHVWDFRIRPLIIPKTEIKAIADELIAKHGPRAEEIAYIEEDRAWRYCDTFQQGKWRRVRRELRRRQALTDQRSAGEPTEG
mgnify:CR=1 FL=1